MPAQAIPCPICAVLTANNEQSIAKHRQWHADNDERAERDPLTPPD